MPRKPGAPSVFIPSTSDDLKEYRKAAERAASRAGFRQAMMEDFPAAGHPPLDVCRAKVTEADVLVAIDDGGSASLIFAFSLLPHTKRRRMASCQETAP
jgi:hypothetical protein